MKRTMSRRALLGAGLLTLAGVGGVGGYGVGLFLTEEPSLAGTAAPLPMAVSSGPPATPTTPAPPPKKIVPDDTEALNKDDLEYRVREFTATSVVRSDVRLKVPRDWGFTQPDPPKIGRYTDPTSKRWIRIEAGFTIRRPPAESMAQRLTDLATVPAAQMLSIKSHTVDPDTKEATLVYTYVPENSLRYVIIRWVANGEGLCTFEIAVTGLPQDREAMEDILDHAANSATRDDSPIRPS
ncbi:hypothetical protein EV645_2321 [Kribbella rubisoli]|uniref:Lipoprotein LpqN n=1 Tax=Kribbella rubisoli TaxID=3075929 RepID=A0A4Q7XAH0_9ACTN|nr:hypothetical protein [Kribbella rubisoli]RZU20094.1 hypothetical protein EV645_2321 [Kribbella rubisoli]